MGQIGSINRSPAVILFVRSFFTPKATGQDGRIAARCQFFRSISPSPLLRRCWCGGWGASSSRRAASRSVSFSSATRNSLVILPLAVLPAVVATQPLVDSELAYIRILPLFGRPRDAGSAA